MTGRRIGFGVWDGVDWEVARDIETFLQQEIRLWPILALPEDEAPAESGLPLELSIESP